MKDSKRTKKSKKEAATILDPRDPGPGEGVGGGVKPLPEGRRERGSSRGGKEEVAEKKLKPPSHQGLVGFDLISRPQHKLS